MLLEATFFIAPQTVSCWLGHIEAHDHRQTTPYSPAQAQRFLQMRRECMLCARGQHALPVGPDSTPADGMGLAADHGNRW